MKPSLMVLDTDVLVDLLRKHPPAVTWFAQLDQSPRVSGLAVMEAIRGCRNAAEVRNVQAMVKPMSVAWPTESDCERALAVFSAYRLSSGMGLLDALIATTALGLGAALSTFNVRHYRPLSELVLIQPYDR